MPFAFLDDIKVRERARNAQRARGKRGLILSVRLARSAARRARRAQNRFLATYGDRGQTAIAFGMNEDFGRTLRKQLDFYNGPQADQFSSVQKKLDDVKGVMVQNIEMVLEPPAKSSSSSSTSRSSCTSTRSNSRRAQRS